VTADELPLTLWPLLNGMVSAIPDWYSDLVDSLRFDHFFIGFDGLTDTSLRVMNKQPAGGRSRHAPPMEHNLKAFDSVVRWGRGDHRRARPDAPGNHAGSDG
jgi:hypothetical protein